MAVEGLTCIDDKLPSFMSCIHDKSESPGYRGYVQSLEMSTQVRSSIKWPINKCIDIMTSTPVDFDIDCII